MTREQWDELFLKVDTMPLDELEKIMVEVARKSGVSQTNADRIRSMTDEELAHFMTPENYKFPCPPNYHDCQYDKIPCWMCWARWLKAPVEEVDK